MLTNLSSSLFPPAAADYPPAEQLILYSADGTDALDEGGMPICGEYEVYTLARFLFVSLASLLALFGLLANLFLFALFYFSKPAEQQQKASNNSINNNGQQHANGNCNNSPPPTPLYPRVLAMLDAVICAVYILLFGVDAAVVYLRNETLFLLYHLYIVPAFVLARIAQLAIPYMLIFATLERIVWFAGKLRNPLLRRMYSARGRRVTVAITLLVSVLLRMPTAWATTVHEYPLCGDFFRTKTAGPAEWVFNSAFYQFYDFHLLSIAQTVFPFFFLLASNLVVIRKISQRARFSSVVLRSQPSNSIPSLLAEPRNSVTRRASFMQKLVLNRPVRSAVYTMVCIVCSYLISNSLHLALTVLEKSNSHLLRDPVDPSLASAFHTAFSDAVSFVYMFTSAIRLLIYYACNPQIRAQIRRWLPLESTAQATPKAAKSIGRVLRWIGRRQGGPATANGGSPLSSEENGDGEEQGDDDEEVIVL